MPDRELSPEEIEALSQPTTKKSTRTFTIPGTKKTKKYDPEIRTIVNWFKLPHTMKGQCEVPHHDEKREARDKPRMFYIDENGLSMCRWCFLEERDKLGG